MEANEFLFKPVVGTQSSSQTKHNELSRQANLSALSGLKVLTAGTPDQLTESLSALLQEYGVQINFVEQGRECVELALRAESEQQPFDVLILKREIPGSDPLSVAMLLRENSYKGRIISIDIELPESYKWQYDTAGCDLSVQGEDLLVHLLAYLQGTPE